MRITFRYYCLVPRIFVCPLLRAGEPFPSYFRPFPLEFVCVCVSTIKQSRALTWFMASDYWGFILLCTLFQPVSMRSYAVTMIRISFVCSKLKFIFTSTSAYVLGPVKSPHHSHRMWLLSKKGLSLKRKRRTFTMLCHNFEMIIINSIVCMMK